MGSSSSKPTYPVIEPEKFDSIISERSAELSNLTLTETLSGPSKALDTTLFSKWEDRLLSDPKNLLALNAFTEADILKIIRRREAVINDGLHLFSHKIENEGQPITNQRSSGRCWLFASTNVMRVSLMKKYNLSKFEFSQQYLFFWDKLEKANYFLEYLFNTSYRVPSVMADNSICSSYLPALSKLIWNLVQKYGLVPHTIYPDTYSAIASSRLNWLLTDKLRENALVLRDLVTSSSDKDRPILVKTKMMEEIYGAMVIAFGRPPKPDESFEWVYKDKDGKFHRVKTTPRQFYKDTEFKVDEHFSLINDPRNEYGKLYTVDRLKNISEGYGVHYVNTTIGTMKSVAIKMLKTNKPVFFGSDVGQFSNSALGVMDTELYDYTLGFNLTLNLRKAERIRVGTSAMTHAMVLTGVDLDDNGRPLKWRVENSWGKDAGQDGYFLMTDKWFDEYVYQIVCNLSDAPKELVEVFKAGNPIVLKPWDPMGSLACKDGSCSEHCPLSGMKMVKAKI